VDLLFADRALFDKFNDIHNGRIFERGHICENVKISDEVLGGIIEDMSKRSFRKFDFDILGNTYETYLGHTLHLKEDGTLGLKPSQETRKESGIYYTPPYVVDYIVKNTLGVLLEGRTPGEVAKIRVLDPACGSGSFLIKTFDYFSDYYNEENERIRAEKERRIKEYRKSSGNQLSLDFGNGLSDEHRDVEYDILVNNLHGVDLDEQACEIAAVNLMLKGLRAGGRMPLVLGETIKTGNSLISGGAELSEYFGDEWRDKKPFNWDEEFGAEGFDVVVGNPPYVFARSQKFTNEEKDYYYKKFSLVQYQLNTYLLFIQQATKLLKNNGYFGFIIPNTWQTIDNFSKFRKFLFETMSDISIVNITDKIFAEANVDTSILIFKKTNRSNGKVTLFSYDNAKLDKIFDGKSDTFRDGYIVRFSKISYEDTNKVMDIIESKSIKLEEIAIVKSGLKAYEVGKGNPKQTKEMKDERIYHSKKQIDKTYYKYLDGKDVCRHSIKWGGNYLRYGECLAAPRTFDLFGSERILVRQIPSKPPYCINATYVDEIYLNDINSMVIYSFKEYSPKLLLSILNSKLISFWFNLRFNKLQRGLFPQFKVKELKLFPIIKEPNIKLKEELIKLADRMFALNKQLHEINTDFDRYLNLHPRIKDTPLKGYIDVLPITDKEVLKDHHQKKPANKIEGKIKEFEITENGVWLVFRVGYLFKSSKGKETISRIDVFKCRIEDLELRKFLYYSIKEYIRPGTLGRGNIYERLLAIRLPRFYADTGKNARAVSEIMTEYLAAVGAAGRVEREIAETDQEIDARVYELYGLGEGEIRVVEG
jgi:type I restriction-modification system DNA methylase subunit